MPGPDRGICEENECFVELRKIAFFVDAEKLKVKPRCDCMAVVGKTAFLVELKNIGDAKDVSEIKSKLLKKFEACSGALGAVKDLGLEVERECRVLLVPANWVGTLKVDKRLAAKKIFVLPCGSPALCPR